MLEGRPVVTLAHPATGHPSASITQRAPSARVQGATANVANAFVAESFANTTPDNPNWVFGGNNYNAHLTGDFNDPTTPSRAGSADVSGTGWLRLTTAADRSTPPGAASMGFAYDNVPFTLTQGLVVSFDYACWGGGYYNSGSFPNNGADGLSFYLFDGSTTNFTPGGTGGGLGYGGMSGGYVGVGLDEFGNWSSAPIQENHVAIHGSTAASPSNSLLIKDPTPSPQLCNYQAGNRPSGLGYNHIVIAITPDLHVTVQVVTANGPAVRIDRFSLLTPSGQPIAGMVSLPPTLKLGFGAATGAANDVHEIRNVVVTGLGPTTAEVLCGCNQSENVLTGVRQYTHNPVNSATGDFFHTFSDLSVPGRGVPLQFTRTYNSLSAGNAGPLGNGGPLGYGWSGNSVASLATDATGAVTVTQEDGSTLPFSLTAAGVYQAPSRVLATLARNSNGAFTLARKNQERLTFTAPTTATAGLLIAEADRNGYTTSFTYTTPLSNGLLARVTDSAGRSLTFGYDANNHIRTVVDPIGRTVVFTYNAAGEMTDARDVRGYVTHFTYTTVNGLPHLMQTMTDPRNETITNAYDGYGRVTSQTDGLNRTTTFSYAFPPNQPGQTTTVTDPRGSVTVDQYQGNQLASETKGYGTPQQATWLYSYDPATLGVTAVTDPNGHTSFNSYDALGNPLTHVDALGRTTGYTYNGFNDVSSMTDPNGVTTVYTYDGRGNLVSTSRPVRATGRTMVQPHLRLRGAVARVAAPQPFLSHRLAQRATARPTPSPSRRAGALHRPASSGLRRRPPAPALTCQRAGRPVTSPSDIKRLATCVADAFASLGVEARVVARQGRAAGPLGPAAPRGAEERDPRSGKNTGSGAIRRASTSGAIRRTLMDASCPSGWTCADIGSPGLAGSQTLANGAWTVQGSGDLYGSADNFHFVWQSVAGDGGVTARVVTQTTTASPYAKAGVMLRQDTSAGAPFYDAFVAPSGFVDVVYRPTAGANAVDVGGFGASAPVYLKVARVGSSYTAYTSSDGLSWTAVPNSTVSIAMTGATLGGLAVASSNANALETATIDSVLVSACPTGWTCADVGGPALPGGQSFDGSAWTVQGGGYDIWGASDTFHFVWQPIPFDGSVSARVVTQTVTNQYAKAGVMLRQDTSAGSAFYDAVIAPSGFVDVEYRAAPGAAAASLAGTAATPPAYVKVARVGNTYTAYTSSNGASWSPLTGSSVVITMTGTLLGGLAVTAHNGGAISSARFDAVTSITQTGATLGYTQISGGLDSYDSNNMDGSKVTAGPRGAQVSSMTAYVGAIDPNPANDLFQTAIYSDSNGSPGTLVASSASGTLAANSWNTVAITATLAPNATYWLIYNANGSAGGYDDLAYDPAPAGSGVYWTNATTSTVPYGTWPATFGAATTISDLYSLYATLSGGAPLTPTPTPSSTSTPTPTATSTPTAIPPTRTPTAASTSTAAPSSTSTPIPTATSTPPPASPCPQAGPLTATTCLAYGDPAHPGDVTARTDPNGHTSTFGYDPATGYLITSTDPLSRVTTYAYDPIGRMTSSVNPNGNVAGSTPLSYTTAMTYDAAGDLTRLTDPQGHRGSAQYDPDRNVVVSTDALGRTTVYTYDQANQLTGTQRPDGSILTASYDPAGNVITGTDGLGHATAYGYDPLGRTVAVTDPLGRVTTAGYDLAGNLTTRADALGRTTAYTYDAANEQTAVQRPDGSVVQAGFDGNSQVISRTNGLGATTRYGYDSLNRLTTATDPLGRTTAYTYDLGGNQTGVTDPRGYATAYGYDPADQPTLISYPDSGQTRLSYDADGNLTLTVDPRGTPTRYGYDTLDRTTVVTDALGQTVRYAYDAVGNRTSVTDQRGYTTAYSYDPLDRTRVVTDALGQTTVMTYDLAGRETALSDPLGRTTVYTYDAAGQQTTALQPDGTALTTTYDLAGNAARTSDPNGHVTSYGYDGLNRTVAVTDPVGATTADTYDLAGNLIALTDPLTHTTVYTYDVANQRTGTLQADGSLLSTGYDPGGNVITQTDAAGRVTAYAYDALGRTTAMTDPLGRPTAYRYDLAGNRTALVDALGRVTTYGYDPLGRTSAITYSDGSTPHVAYTYTPTGLRQSMTDGTGTTTYQYDALERTVAVTNGAGQAVAYAYNAVGDTTAITYPGGVAVARSFDPLDRVTALRDWLGHTSTFGYDPAGNPITETLPNTTGVAWAYNAADALTAITRTTPTTAPRVYAYGRDGLGQVTSATDSADPTSGTHGYRYSALNQLQGDTGGITYTASSAYDLQGITTTAAGATTSSVLGYDPAHELTSLQTLSGTTPTQALALAYNGDGDRVAVTNTVSGATIGYRYDQADRLIGVTRGVTTSSYAYDGDGLRQGKTVNGAATSYTWDTTQGLPTLLQEQTGAATTRYIAGPDGLPLEQVDASGNTLYSYRDQLGSTRELGDASGRIVAASRYDAYGAPLAKTGTASTPFGYAGAYTDGETGLQYLQARYYDPQTAQFLTRDPLVSATGQPYAYTGNNPLNATDPAGLCDVALPFVGRQHLIGTVDNHVLCTDKAGQALGAAGSAVGGVVSGGYQLGTSTIGATANTVKNGVVGLYNTGVEMARILPGSGVLLEGGPRNYLFHLSGDLTDAAYTANHLYTAASLIGNTFAAPFKDALACPSPSTIGTALGDTLGNVLLLLGPSKLAGLAGRAGASLGLARTVRGVQALPTVSRYGDMSGTLDDGIQANHLNQDAAFSHGNPGYTGSVIPSEDGAAVGMRGDAFREPATPHFEFHASLERFWSQFRRGGARFQQVPTNAEYSQALYDALRDAGYSPREASFLQAQARANRLAYGLTDNMSVPRVPGRLPQRRP